MKTVDELTAIIFNELPLVDRIRVGYINIGLIVKRTLELVAADAGFWGRATAQVMDEARSALEKVVKTLKTQDRLELWAHLVSAHAGIYPLNLTFEELAADHAHEHRGPGTIRNHPFEARHADLHKIGEVLSEADPICGEAYVDNQDLFRVCRLEPKHEGEHHG